MFDTQSDLSIWGPQDSSIELAELSMPKPVILSEASSIERERCQVEEPGGADEPWKVVVAGVTPKDGPLFQAAQDPRGADATDDIDGDANGMPLLEEPGEWEQYYMGAAGQDSWWPTMGTWASQPSWLQPGDIVCFHGLQHSVELNGTYASVQSWDEATERWVVLLADGTEKLARPETLALVHSQSCGFPGGMPGAPGAADSEDATASKWWWWFPTKQARGRAAKKAAGCPANALSFTESVSTEGGSTRSNKSSFAGEDGEGVGLDVTQQWTTVMMRNIPNDYTGVMLLDLLNRHGFKGLYTLMYLPMDYHRKAGFGYAFIDFVSHAEARRFFATFEGFSNWGLVSHKVCTVSWSDALQGVQAHIDRYRNSPVMHDAVPDEFKPMLFENGERVPFPGPTKSIRAPRLRKKDPRQPLQQQLAREPRRQLA